MTPPVDDEVMIGIGWPVGESGLVLVALTGPPRPRLDLGTYGV